MSIKQILSTLSLVFFFWFSALQNNLLLRLHKLEFGESFSIFSSDLVSSDIVNALALPEVWASIKVCRPVTFFKGIHFIPCYLLKSLYQSDQRK